MVGGVAHATYNPDTALSVIGSTPAQVAAKFTTVIYLNFKNSTTGERFNSLTDAEWQGLAYEYRRTGGNLATLDAIVATHAPAVYAHYHYVTRGTSGSPFVPPSTGINDTLYQIYLDFRTAPYGAATATSALLETTVFAAVLLQGSYDFGQRVGTGLRWLIVNYDPALDNAIGQDMAWVVDHITGIGEATSSFARGEWEWGLNTGFFGVPLVDLGTFANGFGDFGLLDDINIDVIDGGFCLNPGDC